MAHHIFVDVVIPMKWLKRMITPFFGQNVARLQECGAQTENWHINFNYVFIGMTIRGVGSYKIFLSVYK